MVILLFMHYYIHFLPNSIVTSSLLLCECEEDLKYVYKTYAVYSLLCGLLFPLLNTTIERNITASITKIHQYDEFQEKYFFYLKYFSCKNFISS